MSLKKIAINLAVQLLSNHAFIGATAQEITQIIRGRVYDSESLSPLPGASVIVTETSPLRGTTTGKDGTFILSDIPVGRINLLVSFVGYESYREFNILLTSGREIHLDIPLTESFYSIDEISVRPDRDREAAMNQMAVLSARTFSVEDAQRYAGGMDDPSRLAGAFAGVVPNTIDNNEIVIRGNAAKGLLWRLEGVEIPPPNHFAGRFSGGGVNTMFNSNMLSNSDFFTGAFPAEYGNAISGVFDINMRTGNRNKNEYSFQVGTTGIDFAAEGPFASGSRSSYLVNYRYSTLGLIQSLVPNVTALPAYTDLSFKTNFPTGETGTFALWSINGSGRLAYDPDMDPSQWMTNIDSYSYDILYRSTASGLSHRSTLGTDSWIFSSIAFMATDYRFHNNWFRTDLTEVPVADQDEVDYRLILTASLNKKFSNRHSNRTGFIIKRSGYMYDVKANDDIAFSEEYNFYVDGEGRAWGGHFYSQSRFLLNEKLNLNAGIHVLVNNTNNEWLAEPRLGIRWRVDENQSFSLAWGKHSVLEPLRIYLMEVRDGQESMNPNRKLNLTKAHHIVFGIERKTGPDSYIRLEPYLQYLYDVPVVPDSSFSMINYNNEMFFTSELVNEGTGRNMGVDLTIERFFRNSYYYLLTASLFRSVYTGGDGVERGSANNQKFIVNVLGGKEYMVRTNNLLGLNAKLTIMGGKRHSPVDYNRSAEGQSVVYDNSRIYESQSPTNYYLDISLNYTVNRPGLSHSLILQAKNLFLQKEFLGHAWNYRAQSAEPYELALIFPYLSYKIMF